MTIPNQVNKDSFTKKCLFLDRDGVLNSLIDNRPPWEIKEIKIFNHAKEVILLAKNRNYIPVVVTNQPDAGRGKVSYEKLIKINYNIMKILGIDNSYICTHPYDGMCECRKPKPGMLLQAEKDLHINLKKSFLIGDRQKDIEAGLSAGCKTIHLSNDFLKKSTYSVRDHNNLILLLKEILI